MNKMTGWMKGRMNERKDEWKEGWINARMNEWMSEYLEGLVASSVWSSDEIGSLLKIKILNLLF